MHEDPRHRTPDRRYWRTALWIAALALTFASPPVAAQEIVVTGQRPKIRVPLIAGVVYRPNLEKVACTSAQTCQATDTGVGIGIGAEIAFARPVYVGLYGGWSQADVTQGFGAGEANQVDLTIWEIAALFGLRTGIGGPFSIFGNTGPSYLWNKGNIKTDFSGTSATDSRSESGLRWSLGGGFDWDVSRRFGFRLSSSYLFGDGDNADESLRVGLGIMWKGY